MYSPLALAANATLGSIHSTMISASVNASVLFIVSSPFGFYIQKYRPGALRRNGIQCTFIFL